MVATRNHPKEFEEPATAVANAASASPTSSPRKRGTRQSTANSVSSATGSTMTKVTNALTPSTATTTPTPKSSRTRSQRAGGWSHTPSNFSLIWLAISLPLVIWDTGYVLLRPWSMPGGFLHKPLWAPYDLYGRVDSTYGFTAYNAKSGWTAAQGSVNVLETIGYFVYLYVVYKYGEPEEREGTGAPAPVSVLGELSESRTVYGKVAAWAVFLAYSTTALTFWKTVLYFLNEAFTGETGFGGVRHNDFLTLLFVWIIPSGSWLVFPAYLMYVYSKEILDGLEIAATSSKKSK